MASRYESALTDQVDAASAFGLTAAFEHTGETALGTLRRERTYPPDAIVPEAADAGPRGLRADEVGQRMCATLRSLLSDAATFYLTPRSVDRATVLADDLDESATVEPWDLIADVGFARFGSAWWVPTGAGRRMPLNAALWGPMPDLRDDAGSAGAVRVFWLMCSDDPETSQWVDTATVDQLVWDAPTGFGRDAAAALWRGGRARWSVDTITPLRFGTPLSQLGGFAGANAAALFRVLTEPSVRVSELDVSRPARKAARRAGVGGGDAAVNVIWMRRDATDDPSFADAVGEGEGPDRPVRVRAHWQRYLVGPRDSPDRHHEWRRKAPYVRGQDDGDDGPDDRPRVWVR